MTTPGWGKIKPAAKYAGVSDRTCRGWLKMGLIYSRLPSGTILIRFEDIDIFLKGFAVTDDKTNALADEALKGF